MTAKRAEDEESDLLVIGTGVAGTAAALSAAEGAQELGRSDLRITILEKTSEDNWGGNSRWTTANFRMTDEDHLYPSFEEDVIRDSQGKVDREYLRRLVLESPDTIKWISSKGVGLESRPDNWTVSGFKMGPVGGGLEIITTLRKRLDEKGVKIRFETTAFKLIQDADTGHVCGAYARDKRGRVLKMMSNVVILAGGGFEGNLEMLTKYIDRDASSFRMDVPSTALHMGECINMAFEAGAAPSGDFGSYHGDVVDARSKSYRPSIRSYVYGIVVNAEGCRFIDEGMDEMSNSFEFVARAIFKQPGHIAYLLLDNRMTEIANFGMSLRTEVPPIRADSLEELARTLKIPSAKLLETVRNFNESIQPGSFNPTKNDGKHTEGINPPKSNWAVEIDEPPFYCYPIEGTMQFTWGGLASDPRGRVLATNGAPILGLYAAGEVVGFYYHHYTPGTAVMRALTFGRIAGIEAVRWMLGEE